MTEDEYARIDAKSIDPNRVHAFVPNDQNYRCYACHGRERDRVHTDPRR